MNPTADVPIRVLGPAHIHGVESALGPKQTLLLGVLTLRGRRVSSDEIIDLLWRDDRPANPKAALQVHISRLRSLLEAAGGQLQYEADGYELVAGRDHVDVSRFEHLVRTGTSALAADPSAARTSLVAALDLWRGRPLRGAADDTPLRTDVSRIEGVHLMAVERRIDADLALGDHHAVVHELRQLTGAHPLHEGFRRQLLLALYRAGRPGEALAAYEDARTLLADELGADPAPALRDLHARILDQDPTLLGPGPGPGPAAGAAEAPGVHPPVTDAASVAVLPFEVIGEDPDAGLLAAGLHIDLLTELSRVPGLTVTSRHSVLRLGAATASPSRVAQELGVATVVVGSIRTAGARFRLSVQLVDATAGAHRWAESYDHELTPHDLLTVQQELAADIASSLSRRLGADGAATSAATDMEAYRLVVEGRMQFDRKTEAGFRRAAELFRRAVLLDPGYASAWAGLAATLAMTADYGYGNRDALLDDAEAAVVRALALDAETAAVHEAVGLIAEGRFDAPRSLAEYEAAIRISPSSADAHSWKGWIHLTLGRADEALPDARRAVELNPLSAEAVSNLGLALIAVGEPTRGLAESRRADELSPGYTTAAYYASLALYDLGRLDEAREVLGPLAVQHAGALTTPWAGMAPDAALAITQAALGDEPGAVRTLSTIDADRYPVAAGLACAALGDVERAFEHFAARTRIGYGGAMLRHHHFRDVWATLGQDERLDALDRHIARSWNAAPATTGDGPAW